MQASCSRRSACLRSHAAVRSRGWRAAPALRSAPAPAPALPQSADVVVVGAGMAGLSAAANLQKQGVKDVVLLEASDAVGGR